MTDAAPERTGLDALYPTAFERLRIDWRHLNIPGPPPAFALRPDECQNEHRAESCEQRYGRRTLQCLSVISPSAAGPSAGNSAQRDRIAFIDKAIPHAQFELMAGEVGATARATADELGDQALRLLLCAARDFAAFVSDAEVMPRYGLAGGLAHFALNCDPHTLDRESIQAIKHFHLHYIYWTADELATLNGDLGGWRTADTGERRRVLDPLMTLAGRMVHQRLSRIDLGPEFELLPFEDLPSGPEQGLLGCLLRLPGWATVAAPACAGLLRTVHRVIDRIGRELLDAFTGHTDAPPPWQRHPLLPMADIKRRLRALGYSDAILGALERVAALLRPLSVDTIARLRRHPRRRIRHLSLNLPCYALNLHAPRRNRRDTPLIDAGPVYMIIQPKLFSAVGGAGSLSLAGIPSVLVRRGHGEFSPAAWRQRAGFQREFMQVLQPTVRRFAVAPIPLVNRLHDFDRGWRV